MTHTIRTTTIATFAAATFAAITIASTIGWPALASPAFSASDNSAFYNAWIGNPHTATLTATEEEQLNRDIEDARSVELAAWENYYNHDGYTGMGVGNPHP